jgi:cytochrome b pre-mRNA-processing protein 3
MILSRWFTRGPEASSSLAYRRIVAQARQPALYSDLGVPDSADGRFEMLALHLFLVLHRLKSERGDPACAALAQELTDHMMADMDANLREMGAGDLGVGRRVKRMAKAFYGRIAAYEAGFDRGEAALRQAVRQAVFATVEPGDAQVAAVAGYLVACREALAVQPAGALARGAIDFPPVEVDGAADR